MIARCRAIAALTLFALVACGAPNPNERSAGEATITVRAPLHRDPASLSLLGKMDQDTEIVAMQITDSLMRYDSTLELRPRVAESWTWSADGTVLTFALRPGVRWHDGTPVTADDVVFTVETVRDPATENSTFGPQFRGLASVEALDDRTVQAVYEEDQIGPLEAWAVPLVPRHIVARDDDLITGAFARHPIGCGAFRFVRHVRGEEIVLEANDDYWDGRPRIDRLVFRIYPERSTAYQALLKGDLDLVTVSGTQWHEAMDSADGSRRFEGRIYSTLSAWTIFWNQDGSNPFFVDPRVRQAMVYALDRETFATKVALDTATPGVTTFHPDSPWTSSEIRARPYDRERAEALLEQAGWTDHDGDGVRDRDGRPFRFTLRLPTSSMRLTRQIAEWQQASWRQIGIDTEIEQLEWQAFRELRNAGDFEAASFSIAFTPNPDQFYDLYHSSARDAFNFYGLHDETIDRLLERARATRDDDARNELYYRLQERLYELEPITCAFYFDSPLLHDRRLRGVETSPLGYLRLVEGPQHWYWSEARDASP